MKPFLKAQRSLYQWSTLGQNVATFAVVGSPRRSRQQVMIENIPNHFSS